GCTPEVAFTGTTSISGTDDFVVTGAGFINQKSGLLFWGRASANLPFQGGTLCVHAPLTRTPTQSSGGNPFPPPDCSGAYASAFAARGRASRAAGEAGAVRAMGARRRASERQRATRVYASLLARAIASASHAPSCARSETPACASAVPASASRPSSTPAAIA